MQKHLTTVLFAGGVLAGVIAPWPGPQTAIPIICMAILVARMYLVGSTDHRGFPLNEGLVVGAFGWAVGGADSSDTAIGSAIAGLLIGVIASPPFVLQVVTGLHRSGQDAIGFSKRWRHTVALLIATGTVAIWAGDGDLPWHAVVLGAVGLALYLIAVGSWTSGDLTVRETSDRVLDALHTPTGALQAIGWIALLVGLAAANSHGVNSVEALLWLWLPLTPLAITVDIADVRALGATRVLQGLGVVAALVAVGMLAGGWGALFAVVAGAFLLSRLWTADPGAGRSAVLPDDFDTIVTAIASFAAPPTERRSELDATGNVRQVQVPVEEQILGRIDGDGDGSIIYDMRSFAAQPDLLVQRLSAALPARTVTVEGTTIRFSPATAEELARRERAAQLDGLIVDERDGAAQQSPWGPPTTPPMRSDDGIDWSDLR